MANWERERYPYNEPRSRFSGSDLDDDREGNGHRGYAAREQRRSGWGGWSPERPGERYPEHGYGAEPGYGAMSSWAPSWAPYRADWEPRLERSMRREAGDDEWSKPEYRPWSQRFRGYSAYRSDYGALGRRLREPFGHVGRGPKGYRPSDDRIRDQINEHLTMHPEVDASEVEVRVEKGNVTLMGTVEDRHEKRLAEDIAEAVFGVDDVRNELQVRRGFFASLMGDREEEKETATVGERGSSRTARTAR